MKYLFKSDVLEDEYDKFVKGFPSTSFMQTSAWGRVKSAWDKSFVGVFENQKLVCCAMILERNIIFGRKLFYVPRGFVIDYKNKELLSFFVENIKKYSKKKKAIVIKIDPFICFNQDNIQNIRKKKGIVTSKCYAKDTDEIVNNLLELGFKHAGYKKEVNAYIQPRYTMAVSLKDENGKPYDEDTLKRTFPKNTRNYIGSYQEARGVVFSYSKDPEDVKKLVEVLQCTEKRQHITLRSKSYFKEIMENFKDNAILFFANVNVDKYVSFLKEDAKNHPEKSEFCQKQMIEAENVKKKYGSFPLAGATIVMMPTCQKGIKTASFLYAGTNTEILPSLKITNGLMFYRLCYCLKNGCDYCDLGGVDGSLSDHLSTFKSKFNPDVLELVGEFNLVINKFWFMLFNCGMNVIRFIKSKR